MMLPGSRQRCFSTSQGSWRPKIHKWPNATGCNAQVYSMEKVRNAKFKIGQVVKHRVHPFRGVIFDIDPVFNNTDEWWQSIPAEIRPHKDQPFYHLFAENAETEYIAYVSEQNLLPDTSGKPIRHPDVADVFVRDDDGAYRPRRSQMH